MLRKTLLITAVISSFAVAQPQQVYAVTVPSFPSCVNPQGTLKVSYDSGVHGVVGMTDEKRGSDKVYQLSGNDQLTQCFCPENGNGIQTNWMKVGDKSQEDVETLKREGWIYVADGSAWGLDATAYLAKNSDYNCKSTTVTEKIIEKETIKETIKETVVQAMTLASTGNSAFLYGLIAAGSTSLLAGLILRFRNK